MEINLIQKIAVWALPVLFAITVHEAAHGWMAKRCGDATAWMLGRVSLNPLRHIDPIGTILLPLIGLAAGGFVFGWAKPVPVNFHFLRRPRLDTVLVALAGPMSNMIMAFLWGILLIPATRLNIQYLYLTGRIGVEVNILLMALNLIPLPPLDGGRILMAILPRTGANLLSKIEPYGLILLLILLFTDTLNYLLLPFSVLGHVLVDFFVNFLGYLF